MFDDEVLARAASLIQSYTAQRWTIATAESCTGGLVAAALTEIPGSSAVVDRGFVTYSNAAKTALLGVSDHLIRQNGAVSTAVARAMAAGARERAGVDVAVAITGIAGPGGGSLEKPVGLVHFACASAKGVVDHVERYGDRGRARVRQAALVTALELLARQLA